MPKVKMHYTITGKTQVVKTLDANVATLNFIARGLPGAPEGYKVDTIETVEGYVLTDWSKPPPDTVYITGVIEN
ncbi:Hypothetical predicted protein [Paramuricea clavata]|uniref:Uncharacterized protein n=1 Tax=Paramuricea clavata TaxID=317549 RepID=A0A7D9HMC3_PARCT|nr:Hypothetical predicted protein [Paramuricea clavata]